MNIYINMFFNTKRRKALILNDILQQESFLKGVCTALQGGRHQNPITQPLFSNIRLFQYTSVV